MQADPLRFSKYIGQKNVVMEKENLFMLVSYASNCGVICGAGWCTVTVLFDITCSGSARKSPETMNSAIRHRTPSLSRCFKPEIIEFVEKDGDEGLGDP